MKCAIKITIILAFLFFVYQFNWQLGIMLGVMYCAISLILIGANCEYNPYKDL